MGLKILKTTKSNKMKNFKIVIGSPVEYDALTADIMIKDDYVARISMDQGPEEMILEFFESRGGAQIKLDEFISALTEAKKLLLK